MPTGVGYRENLGALRCIASMYYHTKAILVFGIQDHAPGQVLLEEAGGVVTDSRGELLDFGLGRTLGENFGVIAMGKGAYSPVLAAVREALNETKAKV
jgi:3'-phosphoadenosine 5'-phosphosulfate (PAPS) 3'-phosphatase